MIAPKVWDIFQMVWFSFALILLVAFAFRIMFYTVTLYGALAAAAVFLGINLMILYTIIYATSGPGWKRYSP